MHKLQLQLPGRMDDVGSWHYQTLSGVNYVANKASGFHALLVVPVNAGVVEIPVFMRISLKYCRCQHAHRLVLTNKCFAARIMP